MFDPVSGLKGYPPDSLSAQGCHMVTVNTDGGLFFVGGSMGGNPLDPVVKTAKTYWRNIGRAHCPHHTNGDAPSSRANHFSHHA